MMWLKFVLADEGWIGSAWPPFSRGSQPPPPAVTGVVILIASAAEIGGGGGEKQIEISWRDKKIIKDKKSEEIPKKFVADPNLDLWYCDSIWEKVK